MNCMIVEDEQMAVKVLQSHLQNVEDLKVVSVHNNAMDALIELQNQRIDLIFIDIQLPKMNGLSLLRSLRHRPHVLLTTAHSEFAVEGFDLDVVDYLLKPISLVRFMQAIAKVYRLENKQLTVKPTPISLAKNRSNFAAPFVYIKVDREFVKVLLSDILYIESVKNHICIVMQHKKYLTLLSISEMEQKLPPQYFIRVHRSYIVSLSKIDSFTHSNLIVHQQIIPIGRHYKQALLQRLEGNLL
ncbi:MAG: LytR/AlgR family response regulator transcription factor [Chitinophagales bacterium]